jgi:acetolactate synthase-1/3 small subunit
VKQLDKLINVVEIQELSPKDSISRELILATVNVEEGREDQIMREIESFEANVLSVGDQKIVVSLSGTPEIINDFEVVLETYGIVEVQRTGIIALSTITS